MYYDDENRNENREIVQERRTEMREEEKKKPLSEDADAFDKFVEGKHGYVVTTSLSQDDDMEAEMNFLFNEPKAASYDRYVKTASSSSSKAMKAFCLDNIHPEQRRDLDEKLSKWPALGVSLGEKLLYMLGLSKTTRVRKL
jgi:hypothetical protein